MRIHKKISLIICLIFLGNIATTFGQATIKRDLSSFSILNIGFAHDVRIEYGEKSQILMNGPKDKIDNIQIIENGDQLTLKSRKNISINYRNKVDITLYVEQLAQINLTGSSDVTVNGRKFVDSFKLMITGSGNVNMPAYADKVDAIISGSGDLTMDCQTKKFSLKISGSGDVDLAGKSRYANILISGSGDIDARRFKVEDLDYLASGSGDTNIYVSNKIKALISGSGDLHYDGTPSKVNVKSSGSGDVNGKQQINYNANDAKPRRKLE